MPIGHCRINSSWMVDSVVRAGMTFGPPQVDLTALSDLRLVTPAAFFANFPSENGNARESEVDETAQRACTDLGQADEPDIRREGMSKVERSNALLTLAQILMQAAGLIVEALCPRLGEPWHLPVTSNPRERSGCLVGFLPGSRKKCGQ
jgi:hypothetical protein